MSYVEQALGVGAQRSLEVRCVEGLLFGMVLAVEQM